jgi:hypothetical protein
MIDTYYRPNGVEIVQSVFGHEDEHGHHCMRIGLTIGTVDAAQRIVNSLTERFDLK